MLLYNTSWRYTKQNVRELGFYHRPRKSAKITELIFLISEGNLPMSINQKH